MMKQQATSNKRQEGVALFVAVAIVGALLIVGTGLVNLAVRQSNISSAARESQHAFYAADTGIECALYWDVKNPTGISAFATSTGSTINCHDQNMVVGGSSQSQFTVTLSPDPYCAVVTVTKENNGTTKIESKGYNTCDPSNPRRLERAVRVTY